MARLAGDLALRWRHGRKIAGDAKEGSRRVRAYHVDRGVEANAREGSRWLQASSFMRYFSPEMIRATVGSSRRCLRCPHARERAAEVLEGAVKHAEASESYGRKYGR